MPTPTGRPCSVYGGACTPLLCSRLIEITGQWAELAQKTEDLETLFMLFDLDHNGFLSAEELRVCLRALRFHVNDEQIKKMFGNSENITKEQFVDFVRSCAPTMYEAVLKDVEEGLET